MQLVLSSGLQIADGLAAAHTLGIFHRDLKPANVMLTDGGLIKILDFGLARQLKREEAEFDPGQPAQAMPFSPGATYTARGGTIAYMAPEQFVTGQSSVQSDIFAFGLLLYEMVTWPASVSPAGCAGAAEHTRDPVCGAAADCASWCRRFRWSWRA